MIAKWDISKTTNVIEQIELRLQHLESILRDQGDPEIKRLKLQNEALNIAYKEVESSMLKRDNALRRILGLDIDEYSFQRKAIEIAKNAIS